jgi:hypothetical protein
MPVNRETNLKFGFYKNVCCGKEVFVPEDHEFPDCPNHPHATTIWKPIVSNDPLVQLGNTPKKQKFTVGDHVIFNGIGWKWGAEGTVIGVMDGRLGVQRYDVRFRDGYLFRCFSFELERSRDESLRSA